MQVEEVTGGCLCGSVSVRIPARRNDVGVCHCATCRQWGSGPWMALQVPGAVISGDDLAVHRSSVFAERGFCRRCGTHIFHRPQEGPELAISAGLFPTSGLHIAREIFFDAKPPFYRFVAESEKRSGASMAREWFPRLLYRRMGRWLGTLRRK
ncbi:GFA family protein [Sphingomonas sp. PL-96]|uniref:GFA family protein n=1 Tax=Sphingomonas sp. PL-96 TaxID=2887201 RepID=UPI00226D2B54|nr:GFA family protein [Sphingomonas sp. PL-96]MCC2978474.1 GFA family protein [Sphingomonas sp. PL-96]